VTFSWLQKRPVVCDCQDEGREAKERQRKDLVRAEKSSGEELRRVPWS
jgi:hypothetical protein